MDTDKTDIHQKPATLQNVLKTGFLKMSNSSLTSTCVTIRSSVCAWLWLARCIFEERSRLQCRPLFSQWKEMASNSALELPSSPVVLMWWKMLSTLNLSHFCRAVDASFVWVILFSRCQRPLETRPDWSWLVLTVSDQFWLVRSGSDLFWPLCVWYSWTVVCCISPVCTFSTCAKACIWNCSGFRASEVVGWYIRSALYT